jgi:hypothetical protein
VYVKNVGFVVGLVSKRKNARSDGSSEAETHIGQGRCQNPKTQTTGGDEGSPYR